MRRGIFLFVVFCLVYFMLGTNLWSGGTSESASQPKTTIRYITLANNRDLQGVSELLAHAEKVQPNIKMEFEAVTGGWWDVMQKVIAQIAAGDPPDIVRVNQAMLTNLAVNDYAIDLGSRIAKLDKNVYYDFAFQYFGGKQMSVPVGILNQALYYNKDLLAKAGIPEPGDYHNPWTFEQFRDAAKKLTSGDGPNKIFGFALGVEPARWCGMIWGNGADFHDNNMKPTFNSPRFKETMQYLLDLVNEGSMVGPANLQGISAWDLFESGRAAMIITGVWDITNMKRITNFKVGAAASPYNSKNDGAWPAQPMVTDGYCIVNGTKNEETAWNVLMSFLDDGACEIMVRNGIYGWPVNKKWAEANRGAIFSPPIDQNQIETVMGLEWAHPWPTLKDWVEITESLRRYYELILLGQMSVDDACEAMQSENLKFY